MKSITEQFTELWHANSEPPDVFQFLKSFPDVSVADRIAVCLFDQAQRYGAGEPRRIEEYVDRTDSTSEFALQLIIAEFRLRQSHADVPEISDYTTRFPQLKNQLLASLETVQLKTSGKNSTEQRANSASMQETVVPGESPAEEAADSDVTMTYGTQGTRTKSIEGDRFGDYELLEKIAQGGMGVVYKARQVKLNRIVALKMILAGHLAGDDAIRRFYVEAEAAGRLQHAGIVAIHEVGEHDGQHFFSMEYVEGHSLVDSVSDNPLPARKAARYVQQIAEAIEYAHSKDILHRDLKPGNVLLDKFESIHVTDFGLAKQLSGESDLTASGQILGTPSYMPPEQAVGDLSRLAPPSDVYSLGAILYFLLTGGPPFRAETPIDTLQLVLNNEPVSPRLLNPQAPKDLETICLKCLQKEPQRRYQTALELADDLKRFLENQPIQARPIGALERTLKWIRRKPAIASLIAVSIVAAISLITAAGINARQRRTYTAALETTNKSLESSNAELASSNSQLAKQTTIAAQQRDEAVKARQDERIARNEERLARYRVALQLAERDAFKGLDLCENQDVDLGLLWLSRAYGELPQRSDDASEVGAAELHRADNLRHLITTNITAWVDRLHKFLGGYWSQYAGARLFGSNSGGLVYQTGGHVLWTFEKNRPVPTARLPVEGRVTTATFSPDDSLLAIATRQNHLVRLWSIEDGKPIAELEHPADVSSIDFSRDGEVIATACRDNFVRFWNGKTGESLQEELDVGGKVDCVVFGQDPDQVIVANQRSAGQQDTVTVWSRESGKQVRSPFAHAGVGVTLMRRSQFWSHIVAGSGGNAVSLWNVKRPTSHGDSFKHVGPPLLAFDPLGWTILAHHDRFNAQVLDHRTASREGPLLRMRGECWSAAYLSRRRMLVAGANGELRMWQHGYKNDRAVIYAVPRRRKQIAGVAYGPKGRVLVGHADGLIVSRQHSLSNNNSRRSTRYLPNMIAGTSLATVKFHPDGKSFFTASENTLRRWYADTGEPSGKPMIHKSPVLQIRFSHDGRRLLTATRSRKIYVWDTESSKLLTSSGNIGGFWDLAINPDGILVALAGHDGKVRFWNAVSEAFEGSQIDMQVTVRTVDFSPSGDQIIAGGDGNMLRFFDVETRQPSGRAMIHDAAIRRARFNRDGTLIASAYGTSNVTGSMQLWDTATAMPVGGPVDFSAFGDFDFSPDTKHILLSRSDKSTILHTPRSFDASAKHVEHWLQVITGLRLGSGGDLDVLDLSTWMQRRDELIAAGGAPGGFSLPKFEPLPYPSQTRPIGTVLPEVELPIPENSLPGDGDFLKDLTIGPSLNNPDFPKRLPDGITYVLTPDNRTGSVGTVWSKHDYKLPLEIRFQYSIADDDPWPAGDSGNGIAVLFGKERPQTTASDSPSRSPIGYMVHFLTPRMMSAVVLSGPGNENLIGRRMYSTFTDGHWRNVQIQVRDSEIAVEIDGQEVLRWQGEVDWRSGAVGFLASTLYDGSEHKVRAVEINPLQD